MRRLIIALALILTSFLAYSQKDYKFTTYYAVEAFMTSGSIKDNTEVTDGYAKNGSSISLGMNMHVTKGLGAIVELSLLSFKSSGREDAFQEITDFYSTLTLNQSVTTKTRSLDQWNFFIPKVGLSYTYAWKKSKLYAAAKIGAKLSGTNTSTSNAEVTNPYYSIEYSRGDININSEAGTGSGWVANLDIRYYIAPFSNERVSFFGGVGFSQGSIKNVFKERINSSTLQIENTTSNDMEFNTYGIQIGVSYDLF